MGDYLPIKVIIDTNFLFIPTRFNVDILKELERVTGTTVEPTLLSPVYEEIKTISTKAGKLGRLAVTALKYAERLKRVEIESETNETVDDIIFRVAADWSCPVATNDRVLRKRLRDAGLIVIYLRQSSHLEIYGQI